MTRFLQSSFYKHKEKQPRFASLSKLLADPNDRGDTRRRKAQQQLCHIRR
jgi:hypothetical protein